MSDRTTLLKLALIVFGVVFCLIYVLAIVWPSGWAWHAGAPYESDYFMMIVGVYASLGIFLIAASRDPAAHRSLILFTIVSSVVHAVIMAVQSRADHRRGEDGDVPTMPAPRRAASEAINGAGRRRHDTRAVPGRASDAGHERVAVAR